MDPMPDLRTALLDLLFETRRDNLQRIDTRGQADTGRGVESSLQRRGTL